jgi:hypothetical protein
VRSSLKIATERAEDAAKAEDLKMSAGREFSAAYHAWLKAKAALEDRDGDDEEATERYRAESAAERRLMASPAAWPDQVWLKLGAFEVILGEELMNGERRDSVILLSLASIKQDILNLDMCSNCGGRHDHGERINHPSRRPGRGSRRRSDRGCSDRGWSRNHR